MTTQADTRFKREADRGSHEYELACDVLDAGKVCHVGFTLDGLPYVIPMAYARLGSQILIHGSVASRVMKSLASGVPCCLTVTHLDGLVYARSTFNSSMNYRSTMVFGVAREITDPDEKRLAIQALVDHLMPGRRADLRMSTPQELNATTVLSLPIEVFSTKCRTGPPSDKKSDLDAKVWAGVVPLELTAGEPIDAPDLLPGIEKPAYLFKQP